MAATKIPLADRFWSKVRKTDTCWLWTAGLNNRGYGRFQYFKRRERPGLGRDLYAHRVAWMLTRGSIADGLMVLHKCDTPACVNPDHLFLGTQTDNMRDCSQKGRSCTDGRPPHLRKLTADDVRAIRIDTRSLAQIGLAYGISRGFVGGIKKRRVWRSVD